MNKADKARFIDEVLDPRRVIVYCGRHQYYGPMDEVKAWRVNPTAKTIRTEPMEGCSRCWEVYFLHEIANAPPSKRNELLTQLEEAVHHAAELEDKRLFDFVVQRHANIEYEKED